MTFTLQERLHMIGILLFYFKNNGSTLLTMQWWDRHNDWYYIIICTWYLAKAVRNETQNVMIFLVYTSVLPIQYKSAVSNKWYFLSCLVCSIFFINVFSIQTSLLSCLIIFYIQIVVGALHSDNKCEKTISHFTWIIATFYVLFEMYEIKLVLILYIFNN